MRIASLLPSATEIVFALGLGDALVGVSHACDAPAETRRLPALTRPTIATAGMTAAEIDGALTDLHRRGGSTYTIDVPRLRGLQPDLILTQALCDVCAVSASQVHRAVHEEQLGARVLTLSPTTLEAVFASIEQVGDATGTSAAARTLTAGLRARLAAVRPAGRPNRPRVLAIEWLEPPFIGGHWVPEQIEAAGGLDVMGRAGEPSFRTTWEAIAALRGDRAPEVIIVLPCGFDLPTIVEGARALDANPLWAALPAVRRGAVWALDASSWFSRPGPRLVDGIEALARILADPLADHGPPETARLPRPAAA